MLRLRRMRFVFPQSVFPKVILTVLRKKEPVGCQNGTTTFGLRSEVLGTADVKEHCWSYAHGHFVSSLMRVRLLSATGMRRTSTSFQHPDGRYSLLKAVCWWLAEFVRCFPVLKVICFARRFMIRRRSGSDIQSTETRLICARWPETFMSFHARRIRSLVLFCPA